MQTLARSIVAAVALALSASASAQTVEGAAVTVDVRPEAITVAPWDRSLEARVILLNTGKAAIGGATVNVFSNDRIVAKVDSEASPRLAPGDSFAWKVMIDVANARVPGVLEVDVGYTVVGEPRRRSAYKTLKFTAAEGAVVEKAIEVTLSGSFDAVNETRPGRGYLVVVNNLDVPAVITDIRVQTPDPDSFAAEADFDVASNRSAPFARFDVPARSSRSQFVELTAASSVASGKHHVVLAVDAEWTQHGQRQSRTLLVGQDVTLGVFFESELLTALGVPSFLVLPGCLFLFAIHLLLKFEVGGTNRPVKFADLAPTSSGFWIIAITWSGIFAWGYAYATGTDYLNRYGARDLRNVWLVSILLGVLSYGAMVARNRWRNQNRPAEKDNEMTTLVKMGNRSLPIRLEKAEFTWRNAPLSAFIIDDSDGQTVWAAPPMQLTWTGGAETLPAKQEIVELLNSGTAAELAKALDTNKASVRLEWNATGSLQGPTPIPKTEIRPVGREPMVSVS